MQILLSPNKQNDDALGSRNLCKNSKIVTHSQLDHFDILILQLKIEIVEIL